MKRTHYTHWRGYTVYTPQGIPLQACMAAHKHVAESYLASMNGVMRHDKYRVMPVVLCHPKYFRVKNAAMVDKSGLRRLTPKQLLKGNK